MLPYPDFGILYGKNHGKTPKNIPVGFIPASVILIFIKPAHLFQAFPLFF